MMSPLSLEDINLMDMSSHWKAWDYIYIPLNPSDGVHPQVSPQRPFPTLTMKIALWNIRGASSDEFMPHACDIINKHRPSIFIFLETKCDDKRAFQVKRRLNFTDYKVVNPRGKRGGIWIFWNPPVDLILFSDNDVDYFHGLFRFSPTSPEALVTGMHAPSVSSVRHRLWRDMQANLPPPTTPWMVLDDLNEVTCTNEKLGGNQFKHGQCQDFNNFEDNAGMIDLGFQGNPFTWTNGREGAAVIRERLDRAIANTKWLEAFPKTKVMHLTRTYSDHYPILVNLDSDNIKHGNYPFRCKEFWLEHPFFAEFFCKSWFNGNAPFLHGLKNFMQNVTNWNCNVFGNITKKKKKLLARLHGIQMSLANRFSPFLSNLEKQLITDLNDLYRIERTIWAQKAGLNWRKYGDYNTKQKILTLQDSHGNWFSDDLELKNWACTYFATVLTTTQTTHPLEPSVFNPTTLSSAHQITLTSPVTMQEIKTNLFMMDPIKSAGPDDENKLWVKLLRERYLRKSNFMDAIPNQGQSQL
ncbi:Catalase-peroxidase [Bienertia sinuspersici]